MQGLSEKRGPFVTLEVVAVTHLTSHPVAPFRVLHRTSAQNPESACTSSHTSGQKLGRRGARRHTSRHEFTIATDMTEVLRKRKSKQAGKNLNDICDKPAKAGGATGLCFTLVIKLQQAKLSREECKTNSN